MPEPATLLEACRYYENRKVCFDTMLTVKWPDGKIVCPKCNGEAIGRIESRGMLQCKLKVCRKQFSVKVGTVFEDSPLGLDKWFVAVWCIANAKNGISSHELGRALGITQKSAWHMLHRVREAMKTPTFRKLEGEVESDETFIGGKAANMHAHLREKKIRGRGSYGKAVVHGLLERGGQVRAAVVPNTESESLIPEIIRNVKKEATIYTDAHRSYQPLSEHYDHKFIDHATKYVEDRIHTNGLENFWSLLKRAIRGTYVSIAPFHLGRYLDEQAYRYNARKGTDGSRFRDVLASVVGRRLTYRLLTAQEDAGFMGIA